MPDTEQLLQHGVHGLAEAGCLVGEQRRFHLIGADCCGNYQTRYLLVPFRMVCHGKEHSDRIRSAKLEDSANLRLLAVFGSNARSAAWPWPPAEWWPQPLRRKRSAPLASVEGGLRVWRLHPCLTGADGEAG